MYYWQNFGVFSFCFLLFLLIFLLWTVDLLRWLATAFADEGEDDDERYEGHSQQEWLLEDLWELVDGQLLEIGHGGWNQVVAGRESGLVDFIHACRSNRHSQWCWRCWDSLRLGISIPFRGERHKRFNVMFGQVVSVEFSLPDAARKFVSWRYSHAALEALTEWTPGPFECWTFSQWTIQLNPYRRERRWRDSS